MDRYVFTQAQSPHTATPAPAPPACPDGEGWRELPGMRRWLFFIHEILMAPPFREGFRPQRRGRGRYAPVLVFVYNPHV
jgi:hypothetical protein